jgi:hypothetical protein
LQSEFAKPARDITGAGKTIHKTSAMGMTEFGLKGLLEGEDPHTGWAVITAVVPGMPTFTIDDPYHYKEIRLRWL